MKTIFSSDSLCSSEICLLPGAIFAMFPMPSVLLGVPRKTGQALSGGPHLGRPFKTTGDLSFSPSPAVPVGDGKRGALSFFALRRVC